MIYQFGSGVLFGVPVSGNQAANPTPYKFGVLQEASVEFKGDLKKLFGQKQFPVATARGKIEVDCKAKIAGLDSGLLNQLYFGQIAATGMSVMADDESTSIPETPGPYTITVSHATNFLTDFGVREAASGAQFTRVASGPAAGQYSVSTSTGVYTFAAADQGKNVLISYTYSVTGQGTTVTIANQLMGYAPEFRAFLYNTFRGKFFGLELFNCILGQISVPTIEHCII